MNKTKGCLIANFATVPDTGHLMTPMLAGFGFTPDQASRLTRLIRWPLMSQEEFDRRELNSLLDDI
ncbi:hypothetical protein QTO84_30215 [Klebsiella oxytoca]|uniref:hypothetical protein n=1 Tax=Klebsiella oxytoca TaxID=571 RepID=UPI00259541A1|nr:hypothetical protein [Klebsiella oxytoca]MDM4490053.1 hypothetical protein [Klebsiella oxytoca]